MLIAATHLLKGRYISGCIDNCPEHLIYLDELDKLRRKLGAEKADQLLSWTWQEACRPHTYGLGFEQ
jgi:hypothetical protein